MTSVGLDQLAAYRRLSERFERRRSEFAARRRDRLT
jgi:hypothetical protein